MKYRLLFILIAVTLGVKGQIIDVTLPPISNQESSWQFLQQASVMNGSNSPIQGYLEITVRQNDELILTGQTSPLFLPTGLHSFAGLGINISSFVPAYISPEYDGTFAALQEFPGELEICLSLHTHYEIARRASECQSLMITNFEELHLVTPFNNSKVKPGKFTYTWTHNGNIATSTYTLKIVEIDTNEMNEISAQTFYSRNAFFEESGIPFPLLEDRVINQPYSCDKQYMWSVALINAAGSYEWANDIWSFTVEEPTTKGYYLVPKRTPEEVHYDLAEDMRLRFLYETRYSNDYIIVSVYDLNNKRLLTEPVRMDNIKPGLNAMHLDLWMYVEYNTKVILITITNSKGKKKYLKVRAPKLTKEPTNDKRSE